MEGKIFYIFDFNFLIVQIFLFKFNNFLQDCESNGLIERYTRGYEDYLQCPLQPLMDNLESQTYEVFEKDPVKYTKYQTAIFQAISAIVDKIEDKHREMY